MAEEKQFQHYFSKRHIGNFLALILISTAAKLPMCSCDTWKKQSKVHNDLLLLLLFLLLLLLFLLVVVVVVVLYQSYFQCEL